MQTPLSNQVKSKVNDDAKLNAWLYQNWKARVREFSALLFVFSFWAISQSVIAEELNSLESYSSLWLNAVKTEDTVQLGNEAVSEDQERFAALQLATDVDIEVTGPIARVSVKQRFHNPSQLWAEGEYTYPLPENAAVDSLRMYVGERVIEGQIQEKQQAAKTYAKARKEGKRASLLSQRRSNRFSTQVTNIAPNEVVTIEFEYQHWIDFKDGTYNLVFPMVSTPSYTPSRNEGSEAANDPEFVYPLNNFNTFHENAINPVTIDVSIDSGIPIKAPDSSSHVVSHTAESETRHRVFLKGDESLSNRDFLLSWQPVSSQSPTVTVLKEEIEGESYGLLMIMPPQLNKHGDSFNPRELIIVLDVSGSMQGESIVQAKLALLEALNKLRPEDLFNVIWFNNSAYSLFSHSQLASARNLSLARHQVNALRADGGTNMFPAISKALSKTSTSDDSNLATEALRQVVFITDGAVGNELELFTAIRQQLGASRFFTVGIGSAPNRYFMRKAARAGRGTFTYVSQPAQVREKIVALMEKLQSPALTHIELDFQGYKLDVLPDPLPDLYLGEPLYAAFRANDFPEYLHLSARLDGEPSYLNTPLNEPVLSKSRDQIGIAKEWARRKIEHLQELKREAKGEALDSIKETITRIALDYELVTQYTSLVSVDVTPVRAGGDLKRTNISSNLPKGWALASQKHISIKLAQTSTGLWKFISSGLISILLACFLWALFISNWAREKDKI